MTAVEAAQNSSVIPRARAMTVHSQRGVLHFLGPARNLKANDTRAMVGHGHCVRSAIIRRPVRMTPMRPLGMVRECEPVREGRSHAASRRSITSGKLPRTLRGREKARREFRPPPASDFAIRVGQTAHYGRTSKRAELNDEMTRKKPGRPRGK